MLRKNNLRLVMDFSTLLSYQTTEEVEVCTITQKLLKSFNQRIKNQIKLNGSISSLRAAAAASEDDFRLCFPKNPNIKTD